MFIKWNLNFPKIINSKRGVGKKSIRNVLRYFLKFLTDLVTVTLGKWVSGTLFSATDVWKNTPNERIIITLEDDCCNDSWYIRFGLQSNSDHCYPRLLSFPMLNSSQYAYNHWKTNGCNRNTWLLLQLIHITLFLSIPIWQTLLQTDSVTWTLVFV